MTTYAFPTLTRRAASMMEWSLLGNTQAFISPLSKSVQTLQQPGARWRLSLPYYNLRDPDAAIMQAFLVGLLGRANRFTAWNQARPRPRGAGTGTPLVAGAGQSGTSLLTDGWTPNVTGILKAGDFFGVNGEVKMMMADVNSDGTGQATLTFAVPLRASPADNAPITTDKPTATFMLDEDSVGWTTRAPGVSDFQIVATEIWS